MKTLYQTTLAILSIVTLPLVAAEAAIVTITARPAIPSAEPQFRDWDVFTSAVLNSTNTFRAQHNASDLTWNGTLADFAASYLDGDDLPDCEVKHSGGPYGENLAKGYPNVTASVDAWGDEREEYDWGDAEFSKDTGHFTQLVWQNTTDVGCGRRLCGEQGWYLVCEYWPRGNVEGEFDEAVGEEEEEGGVAGVLRASPWLWVVGAAVGISILETGLL
ncbi:hypothetical protein ACO1O0_007746 [Amphichorda felina]